MKALSAVFTAVFSARTVSVLVLVLLLTGFTAASDDLENPDYTFIGHSDHVRGVAVDSDGYVYSASVDDTVKKISPDGDEEWSFTGHSDTIYDVAVDSDGYVYFASLDGTVRKVGPSGDEVDSFSVDDDYAYSVGVSPLSDGLQFLAAGTGYSNNRVYRWTQDVNGDGVSEIPICDTRGPFNECISQEEHDVSSESFNISAVFQAENTAVFQALDGMATINVDNSTSLSGFWQGSFNISTPAEKETRIEPGAEFKPENGRIIIGN